MKPGEFAKLVYERTLSPFLHGVTDLVYPRVCGLCEVDLGLMPGGERLCEACRDLLSEGTVHRCLRCGAQVAATFQGDDCPWCREHDLRFDRTFTLGRYEQTLREAVLRLKRPGHEALAAGLVDLLWQRHGRALEAEPIDCVAPIPMHWRRRLLRGRNDAELIATLVARRLRKPCRVRLLSRLRYTRPQAGLSPPQRRENVQAAFRVRRPQRVAGRCVLLVDDILTSGATCSESARMLKRAGARRVVVAVLGRAQGEV
jgi:ComF family protein